jgi:hypothetical protein
MGLSGGMERVAHGDNEKMEGRYVEVKRTENC